jgi:tetratricopeptide (TPR) repeat protein
VGGASAGAGLQRELRVTTADEYFAQAAKEYQQGHIDQRLWSRTSARIGEDQELVVAAYLRARATALQLQKRDERAKAQASIVASMRGASDPQVESQARQEALSTTAAAAGRFSGQRKFVYAAAAVALAIAVAVVWLVASPSVPPPIVVATAASQNRPAPLAPQKAVVQNASHGPDKTLETKVQELKKAGNWNVLVLYASEWTRKEPDNAAAWNELSMGFLKLRQLGDALEAATKAVELSPEDARHWRHLGHVNLVLERLSGARTAFEKALAVSPEDADALCGLALVAKREGRAKDADVIAVRLKSADGSCADASDAVSPAVVAGGSAERKTVPAARR